jgi:hypothetical protein
MYSLNTGAAEDAGDCGDCVDRVEFFSRPSQRGLAKGSPERCLELCGAEGVCEDRPFPPTVKTVGWRWTELDICEDIFGCCGEEC